MKKPRLLPSVTTLLPLLFLQCSGDDVGSSQATDAALDPTAMPTTSAVPSATETAPAPTTSVPPVVTPTSTPPTSTAPTSTAPTSTVPPSPPCAPPAVVCEDFEAGAIHTDVWEVRAPNGSVEVVTDRVAHGKYAMKTHTVASAQSQAQIVQTKFLGGNFYGRMYVYFQEPAANAHAAMFEGLGADPAGTYAMSIAMGRMRPFIGYQRNNPFRDMGTNSRVNVATAKWVCVEWNFRPTEGTNNTLWLDGVEIAAIHPGGKFSDGSTEPFLVPAFSEARIGWSHVAHDDPAPSIDIWFDDVAFGPERIGCLPNAAP